MENKIIKKQLKAQLKALKECIKHWKIDIKRNRFYPSTGSCALCNLNNVRCKKCIIGQDTEQLLCLGTPYSDYTSYIENNNINNIINIPHENLVKSKRRCMLADDMINYMVELFKRKTKELK